MRLSEIDEDERDDLSAWMGDELSVRFPSHGVDEVTVNTDKHTRLKTIADDRDELIDYISDKVSTLYSEDLEFIKTVIDKLDHIKAMVTIISKVKI